MKAQIHELRTRLDGLAQLVMSLPEKAQRRITNNGLVEFKKSDDSVYVFNIDHEERQTQYFKDYMKIINPEQSQELKDCHKSLLLSKAWLGKVLEELGEETPYKNDGNRKTVEDIEPTADKSNEPIFPLYDTIKDGIREMTYIEKIDWLREEIQKYSELVFDLKKQGMNNFSWPCNIASSESFKHLTEARFFLGFELQRIKEQSK